MSKIMKEYDIIIKQLQHIMGALGGHEELTGLVHHIPVKTFLSGRLWDTLALQLNGLIEYSELDTTKPFINREMAYVNTLLQYNDDNRPYARAVPMQTRMFNSIVVTPGSDYFSMMFVCNPDVFDVQIPTVLYMVHRIFEETAEKFGMTDKPSLQISLVFPRVGVSQPSYVRRMAGWSKNYGQDKADNQGQ